MIIRDYASCEECDTVHILRVGLGLEPVQAHHFACTHCGSEMSIRLEDGVGTIYGPNTRKAAAADEAPVINLHASFVFEKAELHDPTAFPSLHFGSKIVKAALRARERAGLSPTLEAPQHEQRLPQVTEEWAALQATWTLLRNGRAELAERRMEKFLNAFEFPEKPSSVLDWVFQFAGRLTQPHFEPLFHGLVDQLREAQSRSDFGRFATYYGDHLSAEHARRYFDLMRAYFGAFTELSQVHHCVAFGIPLDDAHSATSVNFDATSMMYGNAFEAFASNVEVLALLNNLLSGRDFDKFENLSLTQYLELDKANRFRAFAANGPFSAVCAEADNQLRNASHHGGMILDRKTGMVHFRAGRGGRGQEQTMSYAHYLSRCCTIFIESMLIFRLEILMADHHKIPPPL